MIFVHWYPVGLTFFGRRSWTVISLKLCGTELWMGLGFLTCEKNEKWLDSWGQHTCLTYSLILVCPFQLGIPVPCSKKREIKWKDSLTRCLDHSQNDLQKMFIGAFLRNQKSVFVFSSYHWPVLEKKVFCATSLLSDPQKTFVVKVVGRP